LDECPTCANNPFSLCAKGAKLIEEVAKALPDTGRQPTEPSLQSLPVRTETGKSIRDAFKNPMGTVTINHNYAQIEMRVMASMENYLIEHIGHHNNPQKDCPLCSCVICDAGIPRKAHR
jgi:hypothetical protein